MADDNISDFFAPPPFKAAEALVGLKRQLRELRPLAERGTGQDASYELRGQQVIALALDGSKIAARIAKRPAIVPEWESRAIANAADLRKFVDEARKRLARWTDQDQ